MSLHWKRLVRKLPKREQEHRIDSELPLSVNSPLLLEDDYQAPRIPGKLYPDSKWMIVRNNLHKIRSWAPIRRLSVVENSLFDWYIFFQMKRELKRAEQQIRAIQYRTNFTPIRYFNLAIDETRFRRYNVSHVRSNDAIYYGGLSSQPLVLQNLLYYFNDECRVPFNSIFYSFLCDVNAVLDTNRQRIQRVVVLRRAALIFAVSIFVILLTMLFSLILSVLTTASYFKQLDRS